MTAKIFEVISGNFMETERVKPFVSFVKKQRGAGFGKFLQTGQIFYKNRIGRWRVPHILNAWSLGTEMGVAEMCKKGVIGEMKRRRGC